MALTIRLSEDYKSLELRLHDGGMLRLDPTGSLQAQLILNSLIRQQRAEHKFVPTQATSPPPVTKLPPRSRKLSKSRGIDLTALDL